MPDLCIIYCEVAVRDIGNLVKCLTFASKLNWLSAEIIILWLQP